MVDFNNETTIGTPAIDIVKVLVLQRRADTIEALEQYRKQLEAGISMNNNIVRARLFSWWLELQPALKRRLKKEEYNDIVEKLKIDNDDEILKLIYVFNEHLDFIRLTRLDTRDLIETERVTLEDKAKRL